MSTTSIPAEVFYPESDGKPMGETDLHIHWMIRLRDILKWRYRDQQTYVGTDLLVYYEEGNPRKFVVPDVFVVKDCDPGFRRIYKIWDEPAPPQVVFEVTSLNSMRQDTKFKPRIYDAIGVLEYFVYDPTADYLRPPLRGFRRSDRGFVSIEPDVDGWLTSQWLDLKLRMEADGSLVLKDATTGERLLTEAEAAYQAQERERIAREAEQKARMAEQKAREAAEAELERLRERLRQLGQDE